MKVLQLVSLTLPLHFAHCQAHYLISLAALHYDISLSELKANLQRHTASENCDEKVKSNDINSEIRSKRLLVVGRNQPKGQRIVLIIHQTDSHFTSQHPGNPYCMCTQHIHRLTHLHIEAISLLSHRCSILVA